MSVVGARWSSACIKRVGYGNVCGGRVLAFGMFNESTKITTALAEIGELISFSGKIRGESDKKSKQ